MLTQWTQTFVELNADIFGDNPRMCEGCPRCHPSTADSYCQAMHPETPGVHPLCNWCKHCVLRGKHVDDAEDVREGRYAGRNDHLN